MHDLVKTIQDISKSPAVEALTTASVRTFGAMNPLARSFLNLVQEAIRPTEEESRFFTGIFKGFGASLANASLGSELVKNTPLSQFAICKLDTPACKAILDSCREKLGIS